MHTRSILSLVYWATIIQHGAGLERPPRLQCLQYSSISAVWTFYVLLSVSSFLSKGFFTIEMTMIEMLGSAGFLLLVSAAFLVYGLRVMRRLRDFERLHRQQQHLDRLRHQAGVDSASGDSPADINSSRVAKTAFVEEGQYDPDSPQASAKKSSHTARIRRILLVVETFAFVVVVAQVNLFHVAALGSLRRILPNGSACVMALCLCVALRGHLSVEQAGQGAGLCERVQVQPRALLREHSPLVSGPSSPSHRRYACPPCSHVALCSPCHTAAGCMHRCRHVGLSQHQKEGARRVGGHPGVSSRASTQDIQV